MVRCSYFEIYNDQIFDLLHETLEKLQDPLPVVEDSKKQ